MRIAILNQFYVPDISPTAHLAASLARRLADEGHEVTVVASRGGYVAASADERRSDEGNPRVFRVWTPRLGKATVLKRCVDYATFYLLALWRVLTLPPQDSIVTLTTPPYIAWAALLHKMMHPSTRVILWNMDCYPELAERSGKLRPTGLMSRTMRAMNRAMFRRIDHLVCLDTAMVDLLMSQYAPKGKTLPVTVIPNWEDAAFFPDPARGAPPAPWTDGEALGLRGKFVVLYLGNMGYGHRFETVLDAAEAMREEPVVFLFIGGGSRYEPVRQEAARRGLANVVMRGYVPKDQTPGVMACAGCALITLRDEILGVMSPSKLHSNLAMRLPVAYVGPATSNVDDAVRDFGCGVSLRHGDAAGLGSFIRRLMNDRAEHDRLRGAARRAFDEAYNDRVTLPRFGRIITGQRADATSARAEQAA